MTDLYFNRRSAYYDINVEAIEIKYNASFMGCWGMIGVFSPGMEDPLDIFYLESPVRVGRTVVKKYLGVYLYKGRSYTVNADNVFDKPIFGIEAADGEVICSRYIDHLIYSEDQSVCVAGGRTLLHTNNPERLVRVFVNGDKYFFHREGMLSIIEVPKERSKRQLNDSNS